MSNVTVIEWEGHSVVTDVSHSKVEYVLTSVYKVPSFTSPFTKFIKPIRICKDSVEFEIQADVTLCNPGGSLHGGYLAALADDLTTYALMASDPEGRHGSTIDMSITFIKAALCGNAVKACARTLKAGRTLAFTECSFYDLKSGELLSHYKQTKYVSTGANTKLSKL